MKPSLDSSAASSAVAERRTAHSRRRSWRWVKIIGATAFCGLVLTALPAALVAHRYALEARRHDLSVLRNLGHGTRVTDRHGREIGTLFAEDRKHVSLSEVPAVLKDAVLATEDSRFYSHGGIDFRGVLRAAVANGASGSIRQGGSTITQQLARQAFGLRGRTLDRKLSEAFLARRIEAEYSKDEILEFYLNDIYLGSGFYGVGAAARGYFGKQPAELSLEEAALLAGIVKAPVRCSPFRSATEAKRVRDLTLTRMEQTGRISTAQAAAARANEVRVLAGGQRAARPNYLLAAVEREIRRDRPELPGLSVRSVQTSADGPLQEAVGGLLEPHLERVGRQLNLSPDAAAELQAAVVVLDNATGDVLASVGGRNFQRSPFDRALRGHRPAGTLFLPLTMAAAGTVAPEVLAQPVLDAPLDNRLVMIGGRSGTLGEWGAEATWAAHEGYVSPRAALTAGRNGAVMRLGLQAGLVPVRETLQRCGFETVLRPFSSSLLGSTHVRPVEVARAFSAVANDGMLPPAAPLVLAVDAGSGPRATAREESSRRVLGAGACREVQQALRAELDRPDRRSALEATGLAGCGLIGHGGTAYGWTDAWFAGSDRRVTAVVWIGTDHGRRLAPNAWAKDAALPLWAEVMRIATAGKPAGWAAEPALVPPRPERSPLALTNAPRAKSVTPVEPAVVGEDPYGANPRPNGGVATAQ